MSRARGTLLRLWRLTGRFSNCYCASIRVGYADVLSRSEKPLGGIIAIKLTQSRCPAAAIGVLVIWVGGCL